ncbi:MAG: ribonuclease R [Gammaproteobacteria bacterium]|nr:ribonuclease R [Gammaproteobacteria bacterium]MCW8987925.1 ribonuclease R [Gammaproteobacteria bacterium]
MTDKKNSKNPADPHAQRESSKYDNPIPSREYIIEQLEAAGEPLNREAISSLLGLSEDTDLEALRRRLRAMERDGQLIFNRKKEYALLSKMDLITGRIIGHADGFGFLVPDDGTDDLFMTAFQMRRLFHGDRAIVRVAGVDRKGRREGALVEVLERANTSIVGRLFIDAGVGFVVADNKRISHDVLIPQENMGNAKHGQIVSVEIIEQPTRHRQAVGKVAEVLGDHMAAGMEIDIAMRSHGIATNWPDDVEAEIKDLTAEVPEAAKSQEGRVDIRALPLVTIDGEDARDFDDAVYCEINDKGWRLLVAIADVSHYVEIDTALDKEAHERGTSVYFPERVIPMLPEILSNGLCSLNPEVDRLCMVCEMQLDKKGKVESHKFYEGVMRSHCRFTYTKVAEIIENVDSALRKEYKDFVPQLLEMHSLFNVLLKRRKKRGAIDFDTTETRIVFGEDRKIDRIVPLVRNDAHKLIEEFMILANVSAAKFLLKNNMPALYRVHGSPKEAKIEGLKEFLAELGMTLSGGETPSSGDYAELLDQIHDRPDAHLIQTVLLRSLQQAVYTPDNNGHFGLAHEAYAHFTSPIRRYPDLLVHRAIRHIVRGGDATSYFYTDNAMRALGEHCSQTERRADEATRDAVDWLKCEFMMDKVGEVFEGTITSVTGFGIFVELDNIYVEGLIHVTSLDHDYYHFDAAHHRLVGERSGQVFRLGDHVVVSVAKVNLEDKKIDFDIISAERTPRKTASRKKKETLASDKKDVDGSKSAENKKGKKKSSKKKVSSSAKRDADGKRLRHSKKKLNKKAKKKLAEKKKKDKEKKKKK